MRSSKFPVWILVVCNILLVGLCVFLYIRIDRIAPTIEFSENDAVYTEAIGQDELLVGVSAYDDTDQDVTNRIVIEKVNKNIEESKATVFYAVADRRGNVTRMSRVFPAEFEVEDAASADAGDPLSAESVVEAKPEEEPEPTPEPTATPLPTKEPEAEATPELTPEPTPEPTATPAPRKTVRQNSAPAPVQEAPAAPAVDLNAIDPNSIDLNSIDPAVLQNMTLPDIPAQETVLPPTPAPTIDPALFAIPNDTVPDLSNIDMSQIDMSQLVAPQ
jgi:hypothetical protein